MREAWALRDAQSNIGDQRSGISEKTSDKSTAPQSPADRLRAGSKAMDHDKIAARLAAIRQGREAEKDHVAQEVERLHDKELDREREAEVKRERGPSHGTVMSSAVELALTRALEPKSCAFRRAAYCLS